MTTKELLQQAKAAKTSVTLASADTRNTALLAMADALEAEQVQDAGADPRQRG